MNKENGFNDSYLNKDKIKEIGNELKELAKKAYCPYSKFPVSAILITQNNKYYGINIENRSYGLTICAERVAISNAILNGDYNLKYLFIYGENAEYPLPPCGACRQVISEFGNKDLKIVIFSKNLNYKILTLEEIYPFDSLHELK
ncbi:MAG: cytidine deaminase [Spirochaetes bacterium]|nr:cytidine deaminase [Spirochaetota bacterium]